MRLIHSLPFLSISFLASAVVDTNAAPHIPRNSHRRRVTQADFAAIQHRGKTLKSLQQGKRQVVASPLPSSSGQVIPVFFEPPSKTATPTTISSTPTPTEFAILLGPPVFFKKSGNTRVCTKRTVITTSTVTQQETTTITSTVTDSATKPSTTSKKSSSSTSSSATSASTPYVMAYWAGWTSSALGPEDVDFGIYDIVDYAFAVPNSSFDLTYPDDPSQSLLKRLVNAAHSKKKKVKLSIGGWTGSVYFSTIMASAANRQKFVNNILAAYTKFNLDGIDIDWEYPGTSGNDGNAISSSDSANYLLFLKLLRSALPSGAYITAATQLWPFAGSNGAPMKDVSAFAQYLDWILLMNYDVWGSSSTPGPNAPLSDACKNSTQPLANAVAAVKSWTAAGMPASKITLGVPSYGYISLSNARYLTGRAAVKVQNDGGGTSDGQVSFSALVSQGALKKSNGTYIGSGSFTRYWDSCSSTPYLRSTSSGQVITYDDPQSLTLKAAFAKQAGIRGVNMFDAHGDTSSGELVASLRLGLGLS